LSILFRMERWLTIAQLAHAWTPELMGTEGDASRYEQDLVHLLLTDIINGRLDNAGPLRDGRRFGLRLIMPDGRAHFLEGHEVNDLIQAGENVPALLHRIVVMKEAVLDFAHRHALPPPSWWADTVAASDEAKANMPSDDVAPISSATSEKPATAVLARRRGRRPERLESVKKEMKGDIQQERLTVAELQNMPEKNMALTYNASRDTVRKARNAVLSEFVGICRNSSNDK
jgi:hypothetical protein